MGKHPIWRGLRPPTPIQSSEYFKHKTIPKIRYLWSITVMDKRKIFLQSPIVIIAWRVVETNRREAEWQGGEL